MLLDLKQARRRHAVYPQNAPAVARKLAGNRARSWRDRMSQRLYRAQPTPAALLTPEGIANRLAGSEITIIVLTAFIAKVLYLDLVMGYAEPTEKYLLVALVFGLLLHLFYRGFELYEPKALRGESIEAGRLLAGMVLAFLVLVGVLYMLKVAESYSRIWMLSWFILGAISLFFLRHRARLFAAQALATGRMRERAAIYGDSLLAREVARRLKAFCPDVDVMAIYDDEWGASASLRTKVGLQRLIATAGDGLFSQIIVALPSADMRGIRKTVEQLAHLPVELQLYTESAVIPVRVRNSRELGDAQIHVLMPIPLSERAQVVKSTFDFIIAAAALVAISPVLAVIAAAIKIEGGGPVFFRQRRCGKNQRVFYINKFRTMSVCEDGPHVKQAERDDCRVTRVGKFLRRTSLDELPQLLNVLKGEMSIVGPRPHAEVHDREFGKKIENFSRRHRVKPGITGWAQINGWRGQTQTVEEMRQRMEFDLHYIDNWSIWLDLEIMVRTLPVVLGSRLAF